MFEMSGLKRVAPMGQLCIQVHRKAALAAGATDVELAETVFVASALRAGTAIAHGTPLFP